MFNRRQKKIAEEKKMLLVFPRQEIHLIFIKIVTTMSWVVDNMDKHPKIDKGFFPPLMRLLGKMALIIVHEAKSIVGDVPESELNALRVIAPFAELKITTSKRWPTMFYISLKH